MAMTDVNSAWTALCRNLRYAPALIEEGSRMLARLQGIKDALATDPTEQVRSRPSR